MKMIIALLSVSLFAFQIVGYAGDGHLRPRSLAMDIKYASPLSGDELQVEYKACTYGDFSSVPRCEKKQVLLNSSNPPVGVNASCDFCLAVELRILNAMSNGQTSAFNNCKAIVNVDGAQGTFFIDDERDSDLSVAFTCESLYLG